MHVSLARPEVKIMREIGISKVVSCPDSEMEQDAGDCVGCEYYVEEDTNREIIICNFPETLDQV